jgi:hypothetical protein
MGLIFRKSINIGPLRVNLSRSGVGYSIGAGGFRTGVRANGRRYTRVSVPGTGLGYQQEHPRGSGCLLAIATLGAAATGAAAIRALPLLS